MSMRRIQLLFPFAAAVAFAALTLVGTGCGGSFIGGNTSTVLNGTWTLNSMTVNSVTQTCPAVAAVPTTAPLSCSRYTDAFASDGSVIRKSADGTVTTTGRYSYNGSVLSIAFGSDDHQVPITLSSDGNTFTSTQDVFGYSVVYSFTKS